MADVVTDTQIFKYSVKQILSPFILIGCWLLVTPACGQYHTKSKKAIKYFERSGELLRSRNYSEAITYLEMAIEKDPGFAEAHLRLGTNYLSIGDYLNARGYLEKAVSLIPDDPKTIGAQLALADIYYREGSYEKALKFLQNFAGNTHLPQAGAG